MRLDNKPLGEAHCQGFSESSILSTLFAWQRNTCREFDVK